MAAGELLLDPAREVVAERALPPMRETVRDRADGLRRRVRDAGRRAAGVRRRSRDRPAGGLPDADREPRGRDAARAVGAARGRRGGLRGHPPDARAVGPLRGEGAARLLPRAQRAGAGGGAGRAHARRRGGGPGLRRRACRSCPTPATCWCAPAWPPGCRSRCCPGRRRRSPRWWRPGCRRTSGTSTGSCRARRASCGACCRSPRGTLVAFESPRRVPGTLALLASLDPAREVAVCRELTKAHEEIVRGSAAELAARYEEAPPQGRGGAGARPAAARRRGCGRAGRARRAATPGRSGRPSAQGGRSGGRADRRQRERAVPGADGAE